MIDLNAAMAALEAIGRVRLYHAQGEGFWVCAVHADEWGTKALCGALGDTAEDAINNCMINAGVGPLADTLKEWIDARERLDQAAGAYRRLRLQQARD